MKTITMSDSIDRLPRGIYKSMMNKVYDALNRSILYEGRNHALPPMFTQNERFSPLTCSESELESNRKMVSTRKYNKENNLSSRQSFMEDYLKELGINNG